MTTSAKSFKVLSIDGGGVRGLYSATILRLHEDQIMADHGPNARIVDFVDLICGTSTGALIALALALRIPAATICEFYEALGPRIFRKSQGRIALLKQVLFRGKYSDRQLRQALQGILGAHKLRDSECLLCIPVVDVTHGVYGVFKYDHDEGNLRRHNALGMVDVALAATAAPTFFPLAQLELEYSRQFADGGLWANNPSLVGLTEALSYFVGPTRNYRHVEMLSIASLTTSAGQAPLLRRERSFVDWAPHLFELGLAGQSEFADQFLQRVQAANSLPLTYSRIPSMPVDSAQRAYVTLDRADGAALSILKQLGTDAFYRTRHIPDIVRFFASRGTYVTLARKERTHSTKET